MIRLLTILAIILLTVSSLAFSATFEVELPELDGSSADTIRTVTYVYDGPTGNLNNLSFRLRCGLSSLGYLECLGGITPPDTVVWTLMAYSKIRRSSESGYWDGSPTLPFGELGSYDVTYPLNTDSGGFTTVTEGDVLEVGLHFGSSGYIAMCSPITPPSEGLVIRASIVFDVTPATPVEDSTWGKIKSLYGAH
jgi:hypothetical protein